MMEKEEGEVYVSVFIKHEPTTPHPTSIHLPDPPSLSSEISGDRSLPPLRRRRPVFFFSLRKGRREENNNNSTKKND